MKLYLWFDRHDFDMVSIGVNREAGFLGPRYQCCGQVTLSGVEEMFGEGVRSALVDSRPGDGPVLVEAERLIIDGE